MNPTKNEIEKKFIKERLNNVDEKSINKELFYLLTNSKAKDYIFYLLNNNIKNQKNENHSSLLYVLGISNEIPKREMEIKNISLPDVDIDINERLPLIEYWENKYGLEKVVQIKTYTYLKEKGSIFAALKHIYPDKKKTYIDNLNKKFEGNNLDEILNNGIKNPKLSDVYKKLPNFNQVVKNLYKKPRTSSQHPAGVILTNESILSKTNLINENDFWHSASPFDVLEANGLTKFDFLPLTTLHQVNLCQKEIGNTDWHKIDFEKKDVLNSFLDAKTSYIFQFGSKLFKDYLGKLDQINSLEELAIICAILRRGPMQVGIHEKYLINKKDDSYKEKDIFYKIKDIHNILKETHGVLVYQEQIMEILSEIADIDKTTTVKIIKILKNKDTLALSKYKNLFIQNVVKKYKLEKELVTKIWENLESFGEYGFPKSHAIAYTKIAYASMYYQIYHPNEWVLSLLSTESDSLAVYKYFQDIVSFELNNTVLNPTIQNNKILINKKSVGLNLELEKDSNLVEFVKNNLERINLKTLIYHSFFNFFESFQKEYFITFKKGEDYQKKVFLRKINEKEISFDNYSLDGNSYYIFDKKIGFGEKNLDNLSFNKYLIKKILLIKSKIKGKKINKKDLEFLNSLEDDQFKFLKFINLNSFENINWNKFLKNEKFSLDLENQEIEINVFVSKIEEKNGKKGKFLKLELYTGFNLMNVNIFEEKDFSKFHENKIVKIKLKSVKWNNIILWNYIP